MVFIDLKKSEKSVNFDLPLSIQNLTVVYIPLFPSLLEHSNGYSSVGAVVLLQAGCRPNADHKLAALQMSGVNYLQCS